LQPDKKLTGFTIRIKDLGNQDGFVDDYPFACKVADLLKIELQAISGNIDFNHDLNGMIWQLDEPQAEPSSIYVGEIARKSREQGIYVLLSGVGGDDLFAGYRRHQAVMFDKYLFRFPYFLRKMLSGMAELIPVHTASIRRFKKYLSKFKEREINDAIANYYKWLSDEKVLSIFSNNSQLDLKNYNTSQILKKSLINISGEHHPINKLLYWDMHYFLPDHNLNYTDKMSMKHGVEVRVPFCDIDLIKLSTIIPPELKIKNGTAKYLLKKVAERYLPHHLIYRPKTGFGGPVRKWVIHDFKSIIEDRLIKNSNSNYKIFNYEQIQKLIEDNRKGNVDASYSIVAILVIHLWLDLFLND
jgi:asparagine synthase (glutamine-hydrolysing)